MDHGFEALLDGTMLLVVLIVASTLAVTWGRAAVPDPGLDGLRYAEETRIALFRSTPEGLGYLDHGRWVSLSEGTDVETFLRIEMALLARNLTIDVASTNARIEEILKALVRPGWEGVIRGEQGDEALTIPAGVRTPAEHYASSWTYPSLDGGGRNVRLGVVLWLSPPR